MNSNGAHSHTSLHIYTRFAHSRCQPVHCVHVQCVCEWERERGNNPNTHFHPTCTSWFCGKNVCFPHHLHQSLLRNKLRSLYIGERTLFWVNYDGVRMFITGWSCVVHNWNPAVRGTKNRAYYVFALVTRTYIYRQSSNGAFRRLSGPVLIDVPRRRPRSIWVMANWKTRTFYWDIMRSSSSVCDVFIFVGPFLTRQDNIRHDWRTQTAQSHIRWFALWAFAAYHLRTGYKGGVDYW